MYKKTGIVLAVMLLLVTIQSTIYFFFVLKVNFSDWLFFNACAPSSIVYLTGFVSYLLFKNRIILYMAILPMAFFGISGLFVFGWDGINIVPQICHIIMILNISWLVLTTFATGDFKAAAIGMFLGMIFSVFISAQQHFIAHHMEDLKGIMQPK